MFDQALHRLDDQTARDVLLQVMRTLIEGQSLDFALDLIELQTPRHRRAAAAAATRDIIDQIVASTGSPPDELDAERRAEIVQQLADLSRSRTHSRPVDPARIDAILEEFAQAFPHSQSR